MTTTGKPSAGFAWQHTRNREFGCVQKLEQKAILDGWFYKGLQKETRVNWDANAEMSSR